MNIDELKKQVTPGEWKAGNCEVTMTGGYFSHRVFSISDAPIAPANGYGERPAEATANAKLIAHYHNTTPELLAAAKALSDKYDPFNSPGCDENERVHERLKLAIKNAETVK